MTDRKLPPISEAEFKDQLLEFAKHCGWLFCHFRPARTSKGWRTAIQGTKGFPDLVLVRVEAAGRGRLIFAELKRDGAKPRPDQTIWLGALRQVPGVEVYLWSPRDWAEVEQVLRREDRGPPKQVPGEFAGLMEANEMMTPKKK